MLTQEKLDKIVADAQGDSMVAKVAYGLVTDGAEDWPPAHRTAAASAYDIETSDRATHAQLVAASKDVY